MDFSPKPTKKVETYSQDLPQRRQDIPREGVQPADAIYQINKIGLVANFYLIDSNASTTGNYEDPFFVAPMAMSVIGWRAYWKTKCSDSGAKLILQKRENGGNQTNIGEIDSTQDEDNGYAGTVTTSPGLEPGDALTIAYSTGVAGLSSLAVTVYLVPSNLGGFFTTL